MLKFFYDPKYAVFSRSVEAHLATKIFFILYEGKKYRKINLGLLSIFWTNPLLCSGWFPTAKNVPSGKRDFPSKMSKMSMFFPKWQCNFPQKCARVLKLIFRALLCFFAKIMSSKWGAPPKNLFSSINSFKNVLRMDVRAKTTFVADFGNYCCFLATWTLKLLDRNFWHRDPTETKKTRLFRKKVGFFDQLEYSASHQESAQCQKFL